MEEISEQEKLERKLREIRDKFEEEKENRIEQLKSEGLSNVEIEEILEQDRVERLKEMKNRLTKRRDERQRRDEIKNNMKSVDNGDMSIEEFFNNLPKNNFEISNEGVKKK